VDHHIGFDSNDGLSSTVMFYIDPGLRDEARRFACVRPDTLALVKFPAKHDCTSSDRMREDYAVFGNPAHTDLIIN
jgi:hypothetical protein